MILALLSLQAGALVDLRVGEADGIARVVVVCEARCTAAPAGEGPAAYRIEGLSDEASVSLPGGALVRALSLSRDGGASTLRIETTRPPAGVRLSRCQPDALCFDLDVAPPAPPPATLRAALEEASGEELSPEACAAAREGVMADAWALSAFRTHALCLAAGGAVGEADGYLARLQAYAPEEGLSALRALLAEDAPGSRTP